MKRFLPLIVFVLLASILAVPLLQKKNPAVLSSALIDRPVPSFRLPLLDEPSAHLSEEDMKGRVSVLNVFASWCLPCRAEQPAIVWLKDNSDARFFGLNYKDKTDAARRFLKEEGNPYEKTGVDINGKAAIDWGVYGVPETFIIDRKGVVRYRHAGPVTMDVAKKELMPLIRMLADE